MNYQHICQAFSRSLWAILPEKYGLIRSFLLLKANGGEVTEQEIALIKREQREPLYIEAEAGEQVFPKLAVMSDADSPAAFDEVRAGAPSSTSRSRAGAIAVLPLTGTISHRMGMMSEMSGGTSTEKFGQWLKAAVADPNVKAIVIDADSPGGSVDGVPELADEVAKAKASKPVIAQVNAMAASAAYWIVSQASEIVVTPSGEVGSIGVFAAHEDISKAAEMQGVKVSFVSAGKYKTEGNPFEPLSGDARQALQANVDEFYGMFTKAVARGRGTTQSKVQNGFGEGRMVSAQQAVTEGMADRVATMDQTLSRLGARNGAQKAAASAEVLNILPAEDEKPDFRPALKRRERELELLQ
jgi:signal peptide peptidase SppA